MFKHNEELPLTFDVNFYTFALSDVVGKDVSLPLGNEELDAKILLPLEDTIYEVSYVAYLRVRDNGEEFSQSGTFVVHNSEEGVILREHHVLSFYGEFYVEPVCRENGRFEMLCTSVLPLNGVVFVVINERK